MVSDEDALPPGVILGPASPTQHLQNIQGTQLCPPSLVRVVYLGTIKNYSVGEGRFTPQARVAVLTKHLDVPVSEQLQSPTLPC